MLDESIQRELCAASTAIDNVIAALGNERDESLSLFDNVKLLRGSNSRLRQTVDTQARAIEILQEQLAESELHRKALSAELQRVCGQIPKDAVG